MLAKILRIAYIVLKIRSEEKAISLDHRSSSTGKLQALTHLHRKNSENHALAHLLR